MKATPLIVEEIVEASPEQVWQAITEKDKMKQWYFDLSAFRAEVGFEFSFTGKGSKGEEYIHHCRITQVEPKRKLQYTWAYENLPGSSLVTFELFPEGNKTRVRVTHEGLETFPGGNPDFAVESFTQGWTELITKLLPKFLKGGK